MRPEETGGFPHITLKGKYYFGKREKKSGKSRRHFLTCSLEFSFHFVFQSCTILDKSFLPK